MKIKNILLIGLAALFLPACVKQSKKVSQTTVIKVEKTVIGLEEIYKQELAILDKVGAKFDSEIVNIIESKPPTSSHLLRGSLYAGVAAGLLSGSFLLAGTSLLAADRVKANHNVVSYCYQLSADIKVLKHLFRQNCPLDIKDKIDCLKCRLECLYKKITSLCVYKKRKINKGRAVFIGVIGYISITIVLPAIVISTVLLH